MIENLRMKSVAIVTPNTDTFSNPTLTLLVEKLIERNFRILFLGHRQIFVPEGISGNVSFHPLPFNFYEFSSSRNSVLKIIKQYLKLFKILKIENKTEYLICIDPLGMVIAGRIQKLIKLKLIYFSFEIFFEEEFYLPEKKILKQKERKYSGKVDTVVVQDTVREDLLRRENNFNGKTKFIHIPVSGKKYEPAENKFDIRRELKIPEDKMLVIYSGTVQPWSGITEIIDLFINKPDCKFWLLVHSHQVSRNEDFEHKLKTALSGNSNVTYHNTPFSNYEEYINFLSQCDIGIATYFPNDYDFFAGKNLQEIGLASGKFSSYMMLGKPTITTAISLYPELNLKYNFGEVIKGAGEIPDALEKIKKEYINKSNGCRTLFEEVLDPADRIEKLIDYFEGDRAIV